MSILKEHSGNLYGRLLDNRAVRTYLEQPVYLQEQNGKFAPTAWLSDNQMHCEVLADRIIDAQRDLITVDEDLKKETEFFVAIAHIMFVPFGKAGYDFLKKTVEGKSKRLTIGEFLYKKLVQRSKCPLNGKLLKNLDRNQKNYIKDFFVEFDKKEEILCSEARDVATFVCRLYFALAGIESSSCHIKYLMDEYMNTIEKEISLVLDQFKDGETCKLNISNYIHKIPQHEPLKSYEEQYILELFDLK